MKTQPIIPSNFWIDTKKICSPPEQLLLLYLINNPHTNRLGCFRLPLHFIAQDLNWTDVFLRKTVNQLINSHFLIWDSTNEWGYLTDFLEWFSIRNYYQSKNIESIFNLIPDTSYLLQILVRDLLQVPYLDRSFRRRLQATWKCFMPPEDPSRHVKSEEITRSPFVGCKRTLHSI